MSIPILSPTSSNSQYASAAFALTDGGTIAVNWNNGNNQTVTLGGNRTITFSNPLSGAHYTLKLKQDATGTRVPTLPTMKTPGGTAITLSTAANAVDIISIFYDGTSYFAQASLAFA